MRSDEKKQKNGEERNGYVSTYSHSFWGLQLH